MGSMTLAEHNKEGLAVWDHSWFASEHLESEISVLRRAACIAPYHRFQHLLCAWHRNTTVQRATPGKRAVVQAIVAIASASGLAAMAHGFKRLKRALQHEDYRDRESIVAFLRRNMRPGNLKNWSFLKRADVTDNTNNNVEALFSAPKNFYDDKETVHGVLPALTTLVGDETAESKSFSERRIADSHRRSRLDVSRERMPPSWAQTVSGVELAKADQGGRRTCEPDPISVRARVPSNQPVHTQDGISQARLSYYHIDKSRKTCTCGYWTSRGSSGDLCKHQIALFQISIWSGRVPMVPVKASYARIAKHRRALETGTLHSGQAASMTQFKGSKPQAP